MSDTKKTGLLAKFIDKIKANKKIEIAVYVALGLLALIVYLSSFVGTNKKTENMPQNVNSNTLSIQTQEEIEQKLETVLAQIRGAGKVSVMITYDTSKEIVPAMGSATQNDASSSNDSTSQSGSESKQPATLIQDGKEVPMVLTEIQPIVRGVIVIAQGAADISVKVSLTNAVQTVLGIDVECIEVFEMDGGN